MKMLTLWFLARGFRQICHHITRCEDTTTIWPINKFYLSEDLIEYITMQVLNEQMWIPFFLPLTGTKMLLLHRGFERRSFHNSIILWRLIKSMNICTLNLDKPLILNKINYSQVKTHSAVRRIFLRPNMLGWRYYTLMK